ncbi:Anthranilate phosphoribosyltransferase [Marinobacterium lacunae]|uniref:Anthranilate phosphoribosyltransferase n=1 Tax=Marinobacterium lacunae TaxID=1232683 RepID=A0A081G3Y1_9GAMM|nr:anthranilate phosphoribosyltransferase [Marinobacterium lacunae]KEA65486.1 Anthranilate phosphoribosyltransferase [Marinobacterium lacunae]MBR9883663.1 anthranilate phosphoribosyltransferase [Oceanospirillales bacterium]
MDIKEALARVVDHIDLSRDEMVEVMRQVMTGQCSESQIAGFLVGLRMKSESIDEITGAAQVMRELATPVKARAATLVDIVGTGGDGANLFNVSSASAFVAAACGVNVAKHGNRGVSSKSGSADLLEQAGINLDLGAEQVARCIDEVGVGFMFAPGYHGAMKHAIGARRALGIRTLFNILGPMTNPAGAKRLVIGVFTKKLCRPMAEVMQQLGGEHIMVVHADDGLDEISLATHTHVAELKDGRITEYTLKPEDLGVESQSLIGLVVDSPAQSLELIRAALSGDEATAARKAVAMVALNAGAAVYLSGQAESHKEGVEKALEAIRSGAALKKMEQLAQFSQQL